MTCFFVVFIFDYVSINSNVMASIVLAEQTTGKQPAFIPRKLRGGTGYKAGACKEVLRQARPQPTAWRST